MLHPIKTNENSQTPVLTADEQLAQLEAETMKALGKKPDATASEETPETPSTEQTEQPGEETPEDKQPEETPEAEETTTPDSDADEEIDLSQFKAKGQERIKDLADKASKVPQLEKEVQRLQKLLGLGPTEKPQAQPAQPRQAPQKPVTPLPWAKPATEETPADEQNLTEEELNQRIQDESQRSIRNDRILRTLDYDISAAEDKYPELRKPKTHFEKGEDGKQVEVVDEPNPAFDQKLTENIAKWYQTLFKEDNTLRFGEFVDQVMSLKAKGTEEGKKAKVKILQKQADEQAIDPSGTPTNSGTDNLESKVRGAKSASDLAEIEKLLPHAE